MTGHHFFCRHCETEFVDATPLESDWAASRGLPLSAARWWWCGASRVLCRSCGIEFIFEHPNPGVETEAPAVKCPTCGTAVPVPPKPPTTEESPRPERLRLPTPAPVRHEPAHAGVLLARLIAVIYIVACFLPAIRLDKDSPFQPGYYCLLIGWIACYLWFPNPLLWIGCFALANGRNRRAFVMGILACICTLPFFVGSGRSDLMPNCSWGFYFWQGDIFLLTKPSQVFSSPSRDAQRR